MDIHCYFCSVCCILLCLHCAGQQKVSGKVWKRIDFNFVFLAAGIGIQMLCPEIRVDFMCVAIGNLLLYNYRGNVVHQIDRTTQLLNRRCYEREIENMKSSAYVLILDINKFKQINDTYGHAEGDRCLALVAQQIFSVYGKYGFCYRIGGDEFTDNVLLVRSSVWCRNCCHR